MTTPTITTTPGIVALQEKWAEAKRNEEGWALHRRAMEDAIIESLRNTGIEMPESGTMKMEILEVRFSITRTYDGPGLNTLVAENPHLIGSIFKVSYAMAMSRPQVDKLIAGGTEFGRAVYQLITDKQSRPSFSLRDKG